MSRLTTLCIVTILMVVGAGGALAQAIVADHNAADDFADIPAEFFDTIRDQYHFFYGHTSHGSQVVTGIYMLEDIDGDLYDHVSMYEYGDDLGHNGDTSWVQPTRDYLDAHPDCNVVMWSWCGGASDNSPEGIDTYLAAMSELEIEYPGVLFVYMTGHLDGSGPDGNLYQRNNQIRAYCEANDKVLFDFADVESWDPDGVWYPDDDDDCFWCSDWCAINDCPDCGYCAHSHCFNCFRKGKAFWWMMARVAGWSGSATAAPAAPGGGPRLTSAWPNPFNPATTVAFDLPHAMGARLVIRDARGRLVATLADGEYAAGRHEAMWHGRDRHGRTVPSGTYFCCLETAVGRSTRALTLLK